MNIKLDSNAHDEAIKAFVALFKEFKDDEAFRKGFSDSFFTDEGIDNFAELLRVRAVAARFIEEHKISCAEATAEDRVYINAPLLVEDLAEIIGYYKYEDEDDDE